MPITGKFFPSQKSQEKVFLLLRRHWFTYFGFALIAAVMSLPIIGLIIYWSLNADVFGAEVGNVAILGVFVYLYGVLAVMLYGFIDYYLDVYIITNERIVSIEQNGFFKRDISELHLHQIQDVSAHVKGIFPTMIHYGDIYIQTAGEHENFIFKSIPNPYRVSKLIVDLHEAQLQERQGISSAEEQAFEDYKPSPIKGRDRFDIEGIDPATFSIARQRTKDFLEESKQDETTLKNEVQEELQKLKTAKLISGIDDHKPAKKDAAEKEEKKTEEPKEEKKGLVEPKVTEIEPKKPKDEGEMHENEEVDL